LNNVFDEILIPTRRILTEWLEKVNENTDPDGFCSTRGCYTPRATPTCPRCQCETSWRGPNVTVRDASSGDGFFTPDLPMVYRERSGIEYPVVCGPGEAEDRTDAMNRLHRIADVYASGPQPMQSVSGDWFLWQGEYCKTCGDWHKKHWMDAAFPDSAKAKRLKEHKDGGRDSFF